MGLDYWIQTFHCVHISDLLQCEERRARPMYLFADIICQYLPFADILVSAYMFSDKCHY